jgi:pyruvate-ferredoxin/flavodoxin oxidoreductase
LKAVSEDEAKALIHLDTILALITQDDVIHRRVFDPNHRSSVPNFGVCITAEVKGKMRSYAVSRQMVLFAVERRKAWRMLQSKAGVVNQDYQAQRALLRKIDSGEIPLSEFYQRPRELLAIESKPTAAPVAAATAR